MLWLMNVKVAKPSMKQIPESHGSEGDEARDSIFAFSDD
jgi:hypothetical protein